MAWCPSSLPPSVYMDCGNLLITHHLCHIHWMCSCNSVMTPSGHMTSIVRHTLLTLLCDFTSQRVRRTWLGLRPPARWPCSSGRGRDSKADFETRYSSDSENKTKVFTRKNIRDKLTENKGSTRSKYTGERDTAGHNEGGACNHTGGNNQEQGSQSQGQEVQGHERRGLQNKTQELRIVALLMRFFLFLGAFFLIRCEVKGQGCVVCVKPVICDIWAK